jgi:hypothetical protein
MSRTSKCAVWEEQHLNSQDKESELRLSLETRVTEEVAVIRCKGRIAYVLKLPRCQAKLPSLRPKPVES